MCFLCCSSVISIIYSCVDVLPESVYFVGGPFAQRQEIILGMALLVFVRSLAAIT